MRIAYFGTSDFAVPALNSLLARGDEIVTVYTQPPRPAGRGHKLQASPVHEFCRAQAVPVHTPTDLKSGAQAFRDLGVEVGVVAAYGLMIPPTLLAIPVFGFLNIHGSLLPRWRGAAPIERAIMAGDTRTGVTIMRMDAGLDTGDICLARDIVLTGNETGGELHTILAEMGANLINTVIAALPTNGFPPRPQNHDAATYARKLSPAEARLDWSEHAPVLARRIRAFAPRPGAWFEASVGGRRERIKVLDAKVGPAPSGPVTSGQVTDDALNVACADGCLRLTRLQRAGRRPLPATDFLRGCPLPRGTILA